MFGEYKLFCSNLFQADNTMIVVDLDKENNRQIESI